MFPLTSIFFFSTRPTTIYQLLFREDVITLQNPHGLPSASIPNPTAVAQVVKSEQTVTTEPTVHRAVTAVKAKGAVPCMIIVSLLRRQLTLISGNISPYSSGMPGASLTSTSVDPSQTTSSKLLWDEVCIVPFCYIDLLRHADGLTGGIDVRRHLKVLER